MSNINLEHIGEYHLSIMTSNMMRSEPEFKTTLSDAKKRRTELKKSGYQVAIFKVTETGGLLRVV